VGPDNGLLSLAAPAPRRAWRIENPAFRREPVSPTFHGRDVFAPAAARLASGVPPEEAGPQLNDIAALTVRASGALTDGAHGEVLHVDSFGNLVTSFDAKTAPNGAWELELDGGRRFAVSTGRTFSDVAPGELLLYAGSGGRLEIAVRDGSAAGRLGAGWGAPVILRRRG
jgi:S-adenosylmethionine hydrolase